MSNGNGWALVGSLALLAANAPLTAQQTVKLPSRDVALRERPASVYTVGKLDGQDWEMFSGIRAVAFDGADNMYLLDGQNLRVVVFDARGRYLRQFGRKGGGPGEFQAPLAMGIAADGSVVVSDIGNRGFVVFRPTGEHVRNVPFDDSFGMPIGGMALARQGNVVSRSMPRLRAEQPGVAGDNASIIHRLPLAADNGSAQALYRIPMPPPRVVESGGTGGARRFASINMDPVFGPRPTFGVLPTGLAVHHETDYAIRILDGNGRHTRTITREYRPRKVTKKDQTAWQERRRNGEGGAAGQQIMVTTTTGGGGSVAIGGAARADAARPMSMSLDNVPFAEFMAVVTGIRTDPHGRIWVQRRHTDGTDAGPIDLVTAEGRYLGTLPAQPLPNAVSASGLAAWVETDDLGVERVVVRRLPDSWR